jgi:uncharacterized protein YutE (UPF0331/DUF86 family)
MVRTENIETKLAALRQYLDKLERYRALPLDEILASQDLTGAAERYLYLACQAAIDAAEMFCKARKLGRMQSMSEGFQLLAASGLLPPELADSLVRMVGFGNALAHGYDRIDRSIFENVLRVRIDDLKLFLELMEEAAA